MKIKGQQSALHGLTYELKSLCLSFPIHYYYPPIPKGCRNWPLLFEHSWGAELTEIICLYHTMLMIIKSPSSSFP